MVSLGWRCKKSPGYTRYNTYHTVWIRIRFLCTGLLQRSQSEGRSFQSSSIVLVLSDSEQTVEQCGRNVTIFTEGIFVRSKSDGDETSVRRRVDQRDTTSSMYKPQKFPAPMMFNKITFCNNSTTFFPDKANN